MEGRQEWRLKRYGRFVADSAEKDERRWKVFEAGGNNPEIVFRILESGYFVVIQGQESLETVPLFRVSDSLKVHQKSDNLMFRLTVKGESRMMRMQFDGSSKAKAIKECASAVEKLMEYIPVTTQNDSPSTSNQTPAGASAPVTQITLEKAVRAEPEVGQGSVTVERLTQHFLGEMAVTLPKVDHHDCMTEVDLEPILRICLLDPSFPAFVERVEGELKKLLRQ